jgi:signal transduction histidine kinase/CheY-like chemotaxis protein/HPt (histidine-containing phosphotransfer) domain-containing protein
MAKRADKLKNKNQEVAILFGLIALLSIGILGALLYGFYRYERHIQFEIVSQELKATVDLHRKVADSTLKDVTTDLILLYRDSRIPDFLLNPSGSQRSVLTRYFSDTASVKDRYDQIRIISAEGQELIRVNYNNGRPQEVTQSQLQQKANRYYVTDSLCLAPGQIYVSPLDLNIEHGEIELPYKPMLRIGTPLLDAHKTKKAVLILNYLADELFTHLKRASKGHLGNLYMLNKQGDSLMGPDPNGLWGFMLPQNKINSFNRSYAEAWQQIQSGEKGFFQTSQGLFAFDTLYFPLPPQLGKNAPPRLQGDSDISIRSWWKLVDFIPMPEFQESMAPLQQRIMSLFLILLFIMLWVSWMVANIIVARRIAQRSLHLAKAKAESANQAKSQFLASMSHEIRTPMNAIIGLSGLALKTDLNAKQQDYLNKIKYSSQNLLGIINDILDFSKIEAGKLEVETIQFNLENTLKNVADVLADKAYQKGLELLFKPGPKLPKGVIGDPLRLSQILINLGNNAIKFTEYGEVKIDASQLKRNGDQVTLQFLVHDTGIGIGEEDQKKLFTAFTQADVSTTRRFGGTGLGLAICKRLVEIMGGKIWVESVLGQGSTFGFTVVMGLGDPDPLHPSMTYEELHNLKVLVVDDNKEARLILKFLLESMTFRADTVESGSAAISTIEASDQKDPYRLVLIDWNMPAMDGFETIHRIRNSSRILHLPKLVMVTAYSYEEAFTKADKMDLDGMLIKPVTPSLLFDLIVDILCKDYNCTSVQSAPRSGDELEDRKFLDGYRVLLVEDNKINQQVACEILEQAGLIVDVACDGQNAIDAVNIGSYDMVLMDIQMPVMDGYEATEHIRREPHFKHLPIIAMTAGAMAGDREKALTAGMDDFVTKPIDTRQLFAVLSKHLEPRTPKSPDINLNGISAAKTPKHHLPEVSDLDMDTALDRLNGNCDLYLKILASFARDYAEVHKEIGRELEAGLLEKAGTRVHAFKGVAGNIGATKVFQQAQALDEAIKQKRIDDAFQHLQALSKSLPPLAASLTELEAEPQLKEVQTVSDAPGDVQQVHTILEKLDELLIQNDIEARDLLEELKESIIHPEQKKCIQQIGRQLSKFDFDDAQKTLSGFQALLGRNKS